MVPHTYRAWHDSRVTRLTMSASGVETLGKLVPRTPTYARVMVLHIYRAWHISSVAVSSSDRHAQNVVARTRVCKTEMIEFLIFRRNSWQYTPPISRRSTARATNLYICTSNGPTYLSCVTWLTSDMPRSVGFGFWNAWQLMPRSDSVRNASRARSSRYTLSNSKKILWFYILNNYGADFWEIWSLCGTSVVLEAAGTHSQKVKSTVTVYIT